MKSIQMTALILWGSIFMVAAFILGQFLVSKDIFDITGLFTVNSDSGKDKTGVDAEITDDELANEVVINKVGQETVRIGQNVAEDYFSKYYKAYVSYIMADTEKYPLNEKIAITDELASDYIFYSLSKSIDEDKYASDEIDNKISISEGNVNSFIDRMFAKEVSETYKKDSNNGYDKTLKVYNIIKSEKKQEYIQELIDIENITSNEIKLRFACKEEDSEKKKTGVTDQKQINIYAVYRGGRYIVTDVEKIEK